MKFCKDCKNMSVLTLCKHPDAQKVDLVSGVSFPQDCFIVRKDDGKCGPDAKLFEQADPVNQ